MNISTCDIILKITELRSLTRTAEHFCYTPSRISQILKLAEAEWGLSLFYREKTGLIPTPECEMLLPSLRGLQESEQRVQEQLYQLRHILTGTLRIGAFTSLSCHWLPPRLKAFSEVYPNIRFELKMGDSRQIVEWTRSGVVDIGLATEPQLDDLRFVQLAEDPYAVVVPETHPLACCRTAALDCLRQEPFIFLQPEDNRVMEEHLHQLGFQPHVQYRVKDDYTIMSLIENGLGISILPELVLTRAPYRIRAVELLPRYSRKIGIILQKDGTLSRTAQCFVSSCLPSGPAAIPAVQQSAPSC